MTIERIVELLGIEKECVLRNATGECNRYCAKCDLLQDDTELHEMYTEVIAMLKAQEPHIITKKDFENNSNVDESGYLPAYCEKIDRPIEWMAIHKGYIGARKDIRYWTGKPTDEQREAVKWE